METYLIARKKKRKKRRKKVLYKSMKIKNQNNLNFFMLS